MSVFSNLNTLFTQAFPEIERLPWDAYGLLQEGRSTKGILLCGEEDCVDKTYLHGDVPDIAIENLAKTMFAMRQNPSCRSSLELRNPDAGIVGGAIRLLVDGGTGSPPKEMLFALGGLPDIGNHLLLVHALHSLGYLSQERWSDLVSTDPGEPLFRAIKDASINFKHFSFLSQTLYRLFPKPVKGV